jgi:hypothetical protein
VGVVLHQQNIHILIFHDVSLSKRSRILLFNLEP